MVSVFSNWILKLVVTFLGFGHTEALENLALRKFAYQTGTGFNGPASKAVDGGLAQKYESGSCTHTVGSRYAYWEVNLEQVASIEYVKIYNRLGSEADRLRDVELYIGMNRITYHLEGFKEGLFGSVDTFYLSTPVIGRWVRIIRLPSVTADLNLCEVQVYGSLYNVASVDMRTYPGMTGSGEMIMTMATMSSLHCANECLRDSFCVAVNYLENDHRCELKSSVANKTATDGVLLMM